MQIATPLPVNVNTEAPAEDADAAFIENMNAVQAIKYCREIVMDDSLPAEMRAQYLSWLFHLVGDLQQPLHSSALFSVNRFPLGDRGGNGVKTTQSSNLHSLWDRFPGTSSKFAICHSDALALMSAPEIDMSATAAAAEADPVSWYEESHELAEQAAYDADVRAPIRMLPSGTGKVMLSTTYLSENGKLAKKRLAVGGYRLAALLAEVP